MKGQLFSTDLFMSFFIFIIVFGVLMVFWSNALENQARDERLKDLELEVMRVSDLLVRTTGYPENWENLDSDNIRNIGLVSSDRHIDNAKLNAFLLLSYSESKIKLSVQRFDYYFRLVNANITKGVTGGNDKIIIRRPVVFNGTVDVIEFELWK